MTMNLDDALQTFIADELRCDCELFVERFLFRRDERLSIGCAGKRGLVLLLLGLEDIRAPLVSGQQIRTVVGL